MSSINEQLKPCPFDGSRAQICFNVNSSEGIRYTIHCSNRECRIDIGEFEDHKDLIKVWNKRA